MKRVLSDKTCHELLLNHTSGSWERVDRLGKYYQKFIHDHFIEVELEEFFGKKFTHRPTVKIIKLRQGDYIPLFSADYSKITDSYFSRYVNTNFIIHTFLNIDYIGGKLFKRGEQITPKVGYGIIQSKTEKCKISTVESGTSFMLLCFIDKIQTTSAL